MLFRAIILAIITTLTLSACGFHLRGNYILPKDVQSVHLTSFDQHSEINQRVQKLLLANDVQLVSYSADVPQIDLRDDSLNRRTLSLFKNAQVAEFELIYRVRYSIKMPGKKLQNFDVEVYRDYQDNPNAVLAKSKELDLIVSEMRNDAADRIIRNLAVIGA